MRYHNGFLVVSSVSGVISIVDPDIRRVVSNMYMSAPVSFVEVCNDNIILAGFKESGVILQLIAQGLTFTETGESLFTRGRLNNILCSHYGDIGVAITNISIESFSIYGMNEISIPYIDIWYNGVSGVFNPDEDKLFVRVNSVFGNKIDTYWYDKLSGKIPSYPIFTIPIPSAAADLTGVKQLAITPDGNKLYVPARGTIEVYDAKTGAHIRSIANPNGMATAGIDIVSLIQHSNATPPSLSYVPGAHYADDQTVNGRGVDPNKGVAGKDTFDFRVIYTGKNSIEPTVFLSVDATTTDKKISYSMANYDTAVSLYGNLDTSGMDPKYRNGDYEDGEIFFLQKLFGKGKYDYHFEAISGGETARLTEIGSLKFSAGYSSVAFIPGLKASRLYAQGFIFEDQIWEPNENGDTEQLSLDGNGDSTDVAIYTKTAPDKGLLDEANIIPDPTGALQENFYKSFIAFLDDLKSDGTVNDWRALPYDWRLAFADVLAGGKGIDGKLYYDSSYATSTPYIFQELRDLADTSDSGMVTIVAHSMGGLLTKKLLADIEDNPNHPYRDLLGKVETIILVASPELGTPQALASVLHGIGEDIPRNLGFFTSRGTARALAQTMHSAFDLFPSDAYLSRVKDNGGASTTVISLDSSLAYLTDPSFDGESVLGYYRTFFGGTEITTASALKNFYRGDDGHADAANDDLIHSKLLLPDFLEEAKTLHERIDGWDTDYDNDGEPDSRVVEIAGWGIKDTLKGLRYVGGAVGSDSSTPSVIPSELCTGHESGCTLDVRPIFTTDGDGTVILPSAIAMGEETYFVDLFTYAEDNFINRSHASILEIDSLRNLIGNIIEEKENPIQYLSSVYNKEDDLPKDLGGAYLRISVHSPIDISIADANGNHVGISASSTLERTFYDEQIPNSYFLLFGEGTYLGVPVATSSSYALKIRGTGDGFFILNVAEERGDTVNKTQTFVHVPVIDGMEAKVSLSSIDDLGELAIDEDGDGLADVVVFSDETQADITFDALVSLVENLDTQERKELVKKAEVSQQLFLKGNYEAAYENLLSLRKKMRKLSETVEILRIVAMIDVLTEKMPAEHSDKDHEREDPKEHLGEDDEEK